MFKRRGGVLSKAPGRACEAARTSERERTMVCSKHGGETRTGGVKTQNRRILKHRDDHDDVYHYIGERPKIEGRRRIWALERRSGKA